MTLCPVALASGCKKCAIFSMCPLKGVIGDYRKHDDASRQRETERDRKPR